MQCGALAVNISNFSFALCEKKKSFFSVEFYHLIFYVQRNRSKASGQKASREVYNNNNQDTGVSLLHFKYASP